jgi:hypothetical protein
MTKENIQSFYTEVLTNRARSWKRGEVSNSEYSTWLLEVQERLVNLGFSSDESFILMNQIEKTA